MKRCLMYLLAILLLHNAVYCHLHTARFRALQSRLEQEALQRERDGVVLLFEDVCIWYPEGEDAVDY